MNRRPAGNIKTKDFASPKKVLGGVHYALAGLLAFCGVGFLITTIVRALIGSVHYPDQRYWILIAVMILAVATLANLAFQSGRALWRGEASTLIVGAGIVLLLFFPIGTVVGIWTLITFFGSRKRPKSENGTRELTTVSTEPSSTGAPEVRSH